MRLQRKLFLAYQTRVSSIFTSADKSYLTYPYPTRGMDKKQITTRDVNTLLYRRSRYSVVKALGFHVIATSHTTSTFNIVDVNVQEYDSLMTAPTFKSNDGDHKVCKKKNPSWFFGADRKIRPSGSLLGITRQSLVMTNSDPRTNVSIRTSHP